LFFSNKITENSQSLVCYLFLYFRFEMYKLPTAPEELKAWTSRTQNAGTQQHASIADVTGVNFAKGDIRLPFLVAGNRWWIPSKSYIRLRCKVTRGDGSPIRHTDEVAPTLGFAASLFQSAEFQIRGVTVSRLTDFVPQVDQFVKRTTLSNSWMETAGESMDYQAASFDERLKNWQLPVHVGGLVQTYHMNAMDLAKNPLTNDAIANWEVDMQLNGAAHELSLSQVINPGTTTFHEDPLLPGDRVFFNGGGVDANCFAVTIVRPIPNAVTGLFEGRYVVCGDDAITAGGAALTAFSDLRVERDVAARSEKIDATTFEVVWQPPLSIFGLSHALPSMSCELILKGRPGTQYGTAAINSRPATEFEPAAAPLTIQAPPGGNANAFMLTVDSIFLYTYQVESDRLEDGVFLLDLEEPNCSSQILQQAAGLQMKQFIVPPSTYQLGVAFQATDAGVNTSVPIGYLGYHQRTGAAAPFQYFSHTQITRMFLQYSNMTFPQPDMDPTYAMFPTSSSTAGEFKNYNTQRYLETQIATGALWMPGGCEPIQKWWDKGVIDVFPTLRDPVDRSTNVVVNAYFSAAPPNATCLLFSMCRKVATIRVANGSVQEVDVQDQ